MRRGFKLKPAQIAAMVAGRNAKRPSIEARFWAKVRKTDTCWFWEGARSPDGYGKFFYGKNAQTAHRVAMILTGHDVPDGMDVDHCVCRDRGCVNPAHLRVVTEAVNALENNESPFAVNKRKTHCKYGHPLSGDNIKIMHGKTERGGKTTNRLCLTCYGPGGLRKTASARRSSP